MRIIIVRHADPDISVSDSSLNDEAQTIINATVKNKQIFQSQSYSDADYTTASLRYTSEDRPRPDYRSLSELPKDLQRERITAPLWLFGYEDSALRFQIEAWKEISNQFAKTKTTGVDQGAVVTAPTGFGKTPAFLGEVLKKILLGEPDSAILVYPSRALLQDHLVRLLEIQDNIRRQNPGSEAPPPVKKIFREFFSVGVAMGRQPYYPEQVYEEGKGGSYVEPDGHQKTVEIANYWGDDISDSNLYVEKNKSGYQTVTGHRGDSRIVLDDSTFMLHRQGIKRNQPNIILTTLESLEILAMKPHYNTVEKADFFVFDEIHEYTGLRGAHAAEIIKNVRKIRQKQLDTDPAVFIGASATIRNPQDFVRTLFAFDRDLSLPVSDIGSGNRTIDEFGEADKSASEKSQKVVSIEPHKDDYDTSNDDKLYYYFMLTPDGGPGTASQYLQHAMMTGHALSDPDPNQRSETSRQKQLAFIDSISNIKRFETQFNNADRARQLWKEHKDKPEQPWPKLATETGFRFLDRNLEEPTPIYSNSNTNVDDLENAYHILGTRFLEIGVDIDDLRYISQYRPPRDIKSFKQRAGRAARDKGNSGHIFTHLSRYSGDANFHYRAERFLDSTIRTPISTDNRVVEWIHSVFYRYYSVIHDYYIRYNHNWLAPSFEKDVLEDFFEESLGYDRFYDFLATTKEFLKSQFDLLVSSESFLDNEYHSIGDTIEKEAAEVTNNLQEIQQYIPSNVDRLLLQESPEKGFADEVRNQACSFAVEISEVVDATSEDISGTVLEDLPELVEDLSEPPESITSPEEQIEDLTQYSYMLGEMFFKLLRLIDESKDGPEIPSKDRYDRLDEAVQLLKTAYTEGEIEKYSKRRKELYYLNQSVKKVDEYASFSNRHGSLYAMKYLFQSAYYLNQALDIREGPSSTDIHLGTSLDDAELWFVPPNYFSDTGRYYTLHQSEAVDEEDRVEENSVDSVLSKYSPMKGEFVEQGTLQMFQPRMTLEEGNPAMDFSPVSGARFDISSGDPLIMPNKIELREVPDVSGETGKQIIPFNPKTMEILSREKHESASPEEIEYGKIHSSPHIRTTLEDSDNVNDDATGKLRIGEMDAKAWIESVDLNIRLYEEYLPGKFSSKDREPFDVSIERSGPRLGYKLKTRGLVWELDEFLETLDDETLSEAKQFKEFDKVDEEEAALVTAAHYLKLLISDVSGVDEDILHYGYNVDEQHVYVFEQAEGGQGIVDLFYTDLHDNPAASLDSVYRLLHNPQVYNEKVWSRHTNKILQRVDFSQLEARDEARDDAKEEIEKIIENELDITYEPSLSRIAEEVIATIQRASSAEETHGIKTSKFLKLKEDFASLRLGGKEEIRASIEQKHSEVFEVVNKETLRNLFFSPDIDSCEANLHLSSTATEHSQEKYLSDVFLSALENYVIEPEPTEERKEVLQRRQRYWGRVDDGELIYLRW